MIKLTKINALIKYELINLKRGLLIWIIAILYAIGIQQIISYMYSNGISFLCLAGTIKFSWIPLNFIMVPFLILGMKIGKSDNDIFKITNITHKEEMLSKLGVLLVIDSVILIANIIFVVIIGIICRLTLQYFLYQTIGYIINTISYLIVCNALGIFIGQVINKNLGDVIGFIVIIVMFAVLCNFYKLSNVIVPLIDIRQFSTPFDVISYDKSYFFHILFWIIVSFILLIVFYMSKYPNKNKQKVIVFQILVVLFASCACIYLARSNYLMRPKFYDIVSRSDAGDYNNSYKTFYSKNNSDYYVDKYNMNISIDDKFINDCEIDIKVTSNNVNSIELGLFNQLNISKVQIDGKKLSFRRTNNSFIVNLPSKPKSGDTINMKLSYEGVINTTWLNGEELFFVRNNGLFLADVFEWYPKLNDNKIKDYIVNIKYNGRNSIYSNLDEDKKQGQYIFSGKDQEIFFIAGNIEERKYKDCLIIGNKEYINCDEQCKFYINLCSQGIFNNGDNSDTIINKIILGPNIPGIKKMDGYYKNAYILPTY